MKKKKKDSEVPSTLPHTSVNREPFGKHLSLIRFPTTLSSAFPGDSRITPTLGFGGDYRFFSTSSTAASPYTNRFFQIAARPLEKDYSSFTRCLKFRQLCAPRHFLLQKAIVLKIPWRCETLVLCGASHCLIDLRSIFIEGIIYVSHPSQEFSKSSHKKFF